MIPPASASLNRGNWHNRKDAALAIVVLIFWLATAAAGLTLLRAGGAVRRERASATPAAPQPAPAEPVPAGAQSVLAGRLTGIGAVPMTADGKPPPGPHVRVTTPDGEHPLLEFSHPTLAVTGIACWMMFTFVGYRPLAWIALAILLATLLVGAAWLARNRQARQRQAAAAWSFPRRLVWLHGAVAVSSLILAVLVAVTAVRA